MNWLRRLLASEARQPDAPWHPSVTGITSCNPGIRRNAIAELAGTGDGRAIHSILKALETPLQNRHWDSGEGESFTTVDCGEEAALVSFGSTAVEPLIAVIQSRLGSHYLLKTCIQALSKIDDPRVLPALWGASLSAHQNRDLLEREAALNALVMIGDSQVVDLLVYLCYNHEGSFAPPDDVLKALGHFEEPRALEILLKAAEEGREAAANGLGRAGDERGIAALLSLINKKNSIAAVRALGEIGSAQAIEALVNSLDSCVERYGDLFFTSCLMKAIGDHKAEAAIPALQQLLVRKPEHHGDRTPEDAAGALGSIGTAAAVSALEKTIRENDQKHAAIWGLRQKGNRLAIAALKRLLGDIKNIRLPSHYIEDKECYFRDLERQIAESLSEIADA